MGSQTFQLEPYKHGGSNRYTCPECKRRKCFTRYINTDTGEYVDDSCGKCDHLSSCGYHYTPKQFFLEHQNEETWRTPRPYRQYPTLPPQPKPMAVIPPEIVRQYHSQNSQLMSYLNRQFPTHHDALKRIYEDYQLGATRDHGIIFWQTDIEGRTRTGKVMHYHPDGHRIKDAADYAAFLGRQLDIHSPQPTYFMHRTLRRQDVIDTQQLTIINYHTCNISISYLNTSLSLNIVKYHVISQKRGIKINVIP